MEDRVCRLGLFDFLHIRDIDFFTDGNVKLIKIFMDCFYILSLDDLDVAPNFVTKFFAVTGLHPEKGTVFAY